MLDIRKYRNAVEDKIRFIEIGATESIANMADYAQMVGQKLGLRDALVILDQILAEESETEEENDKDNEATG